jgi:ribosome maturation factor RimP
VYELAEEAASALGLEVLRARLMSAAGRSRLVVTVERPDAEVSLDDLSALSEALGRRLDGEDPIPRSYVLECESPGPHRPIRLPQDAPRFAGAQVAVRFSAPGRRRLRGRLVAVDLDGLRLSTQAADGGEVVLPLAEIDEVLLDEREAPPAAGPRRKGRGR